MNVCIVGLGLIGGSFARAARELAACRVYAWDRDRSTLLAAKTAGAIDGILDDSALKEADFLILALYPKATVQYLKEHAEQLCERTVVFDTCGVKRPVCEACEALAHEHGFTFIGGHPMAGTQYSGFSHSRASLFKGATMILCPRQEEDFSKIEQLRTFLLSLGFGKLCYATPQVHDRMIAYTSQLAHVVSNAYVKSPQAMGHRGFSAGSFRDLTRVARLNPDMWTELFLENRDFLIDELDTLIQNLKTYRDALAAEDEASLHAALKEGSDRKVRSERNN